MNTSWISVANEAKLNFGETVSTQSGRVWYLDYFKFMVEFHVFTLCTNLDRIWQCKGHQGFHGDNPRRDSGSKTLAQEWTEGDILPFLKITS